MHHRLTQTINRLITRRTTHTDARIAEHWRRQQEADLAQITDLTNRLAEIRTLATEPEIGGWELRTRLDAILTRQDTR